MSNTARIAATAANTLTKPLNVEEVFSTYLYTGNGAGEGTVMQTITNGIDLSGEGGLVWIKSRSIRDHNLQDTERGIASQLASNTTAAADGFTNRVSAFNSNGFDLDGNVYVNSNAEDYASWTFRKAPKFFDVVTYTGDGTSSRAISHSLGSTPGCIIIKRTDASAAWTIFHRGLSGGITGSRILFDTGAATAFSNITAVDDSTFTVISTGVNNTGGTYVAYLFAHNNGDGDFGPTGDQDIIKCGSYTGNYNSGSEPNIDLGFEPQWILFKNTTTASNWFIYDTMRGWSETSPDYSLAPDSSAAENGASGSAQAGKPTATGFDLEGCGLTAVNSLGDTHIYIAIRRGPMAVPESATDVFDVAARVGASGNQGAYQSGFPVDMAFHKVVTSSINPYEIGSRLTQGKSMKTNATDAESTTSDQQYDYMDGWNSETSAASTKYSWMWKRAPNFCDVVAYSGNNTAGNAISHNLGVVPEMMWIKSRSNAVSWIVYHKDLNSGTNPEDYYLILNSTNAETNDSTGDYFNSTAPTATNFTLGGSFWVNGTSNIAYLFASLDGVSKVGSYTGNGSTTGDAQNIDCGFSSGARFVLIKASSAAYSWMLFDTERGITSGNDSLLLLNATDAETTAFDSVDPYSSGFTAVQGPYNVNQSGVEYIFYAIA